MDPFSFQEELFSFQEELFHDEPLWTFSPEPVDLPPPIPGHPMVPQSAFISYSRPYGGQPPIPVGPRSGNPRNIHRRVIELLRRIPNPQTESRAGEEGRGFRHMMRERQRREKLSQNYADLYSMISSRSKADKNSIVQSAAVYVRELKGVKEELRRRNEELKARLVMSTARAEGEKIRMRMLNPSSAIDSMIEALRCLKSMDVKATAVQSDLSDHEMSAVVSVGTNKVAATELERTVEGALMEVEQKLRALLPRRGGGSRHCHMEN